jgi:hypothetical protein
VGIVVRQVALKQPAINHLESRLCFIVLTNPSLLEAPSVFVDLGDAGFVHQDIDVL